MSDPRATMNTDDRAAYEEALKRIMLARRRQESRLELGFRGLKYLPQEIAQLSELKELYLGENQLTVLPTGIGQLSALRVLHLGGNYLTSLPKNSAAVWLLPQALLNTQPPGLTTFRDAAGATRLRYTYQALPEGLVARAIVRLHEFIERDAKGKGQQWSSGALLVREGARALLRTEPQDRQVMITVLGPTSARQQLAGLCQAEMRDIHEEIRGLYPLEEMQVQGAWVATETMEADERNRRPTGIATPGRTLEVDPEQSNNAFSKKAARVSGVWKPRVFISYSKANVTQRKRLELELTILKNEGLVAAHWHDRMIDPGDPWDEAIQLQINAADVLVVLISAEALGTDYIMKHEIPKALEMQAAGKLVLIPLILEACRWDKTALGNLNALPEKAKPLNKYPQKADAWKLVSDVLAKVFERLKTERRGRAPTLLGTQGVICDVESGNY